MTIREIQFSDLDEILRIQADAYQAELLESADTFARKISLFPKGCVAFEDDSQLHAYVFSHPWKGREPVTLDLPTLELPLAPDCYYIHDLAVETTHRSKGIGESLVDYLEKISEPLHLRRWALVAVQGSEPFWGKLGFVPVTNLVYVDNVPATFMTRERND